MDLVRSAKKVYLQKIISYLQQTVVWSRGGRISPPANKWECGLGLKHQERKVIGSEVITAMTKLEPAQTQPVNDAVNA